MKSGSNTRGFTIVEVMIFLAVSSAILVGTIPLISGSQNKTKFTQSTNDFQQQVTTVVNNVANGYYPPAKGTCDTATDPLTIAGTELAQGTGSECVFLGRIMSFSSTDESFKIYSVIGLRQTGGVLKSEVKNMSQAKASVVTVNPEPDVIKLKDGLTVESVKQGTTDVGAVGFFTGFAQGDIVTGQLISGALSSDFVAIKGSSLTTDKIADLISKNTEAPDEFRTYYEASKNPSDGIQICLKSGTTNQYGIITIGGKNKVATTTLDVKDSCS